MTNADCNAYERGYKDGQYDALAGAVLNPDTLVMWFEFERRDGIWKNHQKIQYLTGYRRGAKGESK